MRPYSPVPLCGIDVVIGLYLKQVAESKERQERMRRFSALANTPALERYAALAGHKLDKAPDVR